MIDPDEQSGNVAARPARPVLAYVSSRDWNASGRQRIKRLVAVICVAAAGAFLVAILMPSLNRPRDGDGYGRLKCASNLRQIGQSLQIYSIEHGGVYPPSFDELVVAGDITSEVFVCPYSSDARAEGPTTQALLQDFRTPGHNSYVYVIGSVPERTLSPTHVVAYDAPNNHGAADGMNVLYGDGHVDWVPKRDAVYLLSELQARFNPPRPAATQPRAGP
jgi:prepilin-type processing-associated H-X9-DG protein